MNYWKKEQTLIWRTNLEYLRNGLTVILSMDKWKLEHLKLIIQKFCSLRENQWNVSPPLTHRQKLIRAFS